MTRKLHVHTNMLNNEHNAVLMDTTSSYNNLPAVVESALATPGMSSSNIQFQDLQTRDEKLIEATIVALETGELTPLIKEELRCTIQSRRLRAGKGEMKVVFDEPKELGPLSMEEKERIERRREQNRQAAQRFRKKQKEMGSHLVRRTQNIEADNTRLAFEIRKLRQEKEHLKRKLDAHLLVCPGIGMNT